METLRAFLSRFHFLYIPTFLFRFRPTFLSRFHFSRRTFLLRFYIFGRPLIFVDFYGIACIFIHFYCFGGLAAPEPYTNNDLGAWGLQNLTKSMVWGPGAWAPAGPIRPPNVSVTFPSRFCYVSNVSKMHGLVAAPPGPRPQAPKPLIS